MSPDDTPWLRLCRIDEVSEDAPLQCREGNLDYAVFQVGSAYFVLADRCSHGPGSLSEGYVENGEVECPFHQGRFDIRTGCPTAAPCTVPVKSWAVRVIDGAIHIQAAAGETAPCAVRAA